jgi:hypothetical protein
LSMSKPIDTGFRRYSASAHSRRRSSMLSLAFAAVCTALHGGSKILIN